MQNGNSYTRDSYHFLERIKNFHTIPDSAMLVTADVMGLYPSSPHSADLNSLKKAIEKHFKKQIPTSDLVKIAKFVLSNNYFEFSESFSTNIRNANRHKVCPSICMYLYG